MDKVTGMAGSKAWWGSCRRKKPRWRIDFQDGVGRFTAGPIGRRGEVYDAVLRSIPGNSMRCTFAAAQASAGQSSRPAHVAPPSQGRSKSAPACRIYGDLNALKRHEEEALASFERRWRSIKARRMPSALLQSRPALKGLRRPRARRGL